MSSFCQEEDNKVRAKVENMFLVYEWRNCIYKGIYNAHAVSMKRLALYGTHNIDTDVYCNVHKVATW